MATVGGFEHFVDGMRAGLPASAFTVAMGRVATEPERDNWLVASVVVGVYGNLSEGNARIIVAPENRQDRDRRIQVYGATMTGREVSMSWFPEAPIFDPNTRGSLYHDMAVHAGGNHHQKPGRAKRALILPEAYEELGARQAGHWDFFWASADLLTEQSTFLGTPLKPFRPRK